MASMEELNHRWPEITQRLVSQLPKKKNIWMMTKTFGIKFCRLMSQKWNFLEDMDPISSCVKLTQHSTIWTLYQQSWWWSGLYQKILKENVWLSVCDQSLSTVKLCSSTMIWSTQAHPPLNGSKETKSGQETKVGTWIQLRCCGMTSNRQFMLKNPVAN